METGKASRTAMGSALLRAAHVREDPSPWIFEDTLSARLVDATTVAEFEALMASWPPVRRQSFRVHQAVRARLAEDLAAAGLAAGRRDYVLLGAGLDTFAWRHPLASEFTVWEIDHPDTAAWKRAALRRAGLDEPANVRFVAADLSRTAIGELGTPVSATWNWLGVTMYLPPEATMATLRVIAEGHTGTTLAVEFVLDSGELDAPALAARESAETAVAAAGEPVVAAYKRAEITELLAEAGFSGIELFDASRLRERYLRDRPDLPLHVPTAIAVATV